MIRNSKHPGFAERRRSVQAFMERMPNPSLSCEPNTSVSITGISRYRDMASEQASVPESVDLIRIQVVPRTCTSSP